MRLLLLSLCLTGCAKLNDDFPHNLMPACIRSDVAPFDPHNYGAWWHDMQFKPMNPG